MTEPPLPEAARSRPVSPALPQHGRSRRDWLPQHSRARVARSHLSLLITCDFVFLTCTIIRVNSLTSKRVRESPRNFEKLVLGCIDGAFCKKILVVQHTRWEGLDEIYKIYTLLQRSDLI